MPERSFARYLAPLALVIVVIATFAIISGAGGGDDAGDRDQGGAATAEETRGSSRDRRAKKYYRVQDGDLLSTIAEQTGVPTERLIELNPDLDPQALQTGQLVRIRR